eukprot:m51a1_g3106 putative telomerase protein component 1-like (1777) ;mRNA; r:128486-138813
MWTKWYGWTVPEQRGSCRGGVSWALTSDRSALGRADAVVFHAREFRAGEAPGRRAAQPWVLMSKESPASDAPHFDRTGNATRLFNFTSTYEWESDGWRPYLPRDIASITSPALPTRLKRRSGTSQSAQPAMSKWRSARVFISSTFKDFHGERDHLTRCVFPELQERCARLRVRVTPVDLRWGVTEENTQQALELCLAEVDSCRPFFVGMLGERYGWTPAAYDVPDGPAYDWVRALPKGYSITHLEIMHGALNDPAKAHAAIYLRDPTFMQNVPPDVARDFACESPHCQRQLDDLKRQIRASASKVALFDGYLCGWRGVVDGKPMLGGLEAFGQHVLEFLWSRILAVFPAPDDAAAAADPLLAARAEHDDFIESHSRGFVGRQALLDELSSHASSCRPTVVVGEPGGGKTSLMAAFCRSAQQREQREGRNVVAHFVGAAPGSTDIRRLLARLCGETLRAMGAAGEEVPLGYSELKALFARLVLERAREWKGRLLIVVDALNQLDDAYGALGLEWLPLETAANVDVVVSTLPGRCLDVLRRREAPEVAVGPLAPDEQREIVRKTLWEYRKQLDERQTSELLAKPDAQRPLYLVVACEELRVFGVYERVGEFIRGLPGTVAGLFRAVLERLEKDHGEEAVRNALSLVRCSRGGLFEAEMLELLGYAAQMQTPPRGPGLRQPLSQSVWARLYRSLRAYLSPVGAGGDGVLNFFHQQLAFAVDGRYLSGDTLLRAHRRLAELFLSRADPRHDGAWAAGDVRAAGELPYHQTMGRMWQELAKTLCDLAFVEARCRSGTSYELVADYLRASGESLAAGESDGGLSDDFRARFPALAARVHDFQEFLQMRVHVVAKKPHETFCLAANLPANSAASAAARERWARGAEKRPWVEWVNKPRSNSACVLTFVGHALPCRACHVCPSDATLALSASDDATVHVFDTRTGQEKLTVRGHRGPVLSACFSPDGKLIASASSDRSVRLWNSTTGVEVAKLQHKQAVNKVAFSPDGELVCSACADKTARVWSVATHEAVQVLDHDAPVLAASFSPDGTLLGTASAGKVLVWRVADWSQTSSIVAHAKQVNSIKWSADGRLLLTASEDRTVCVSRLKDQSRVSLMSDAFDGVCDAEFTSDGERILTVGHDNVVRVYSFDVSSTSYRSSAQLMCCLTGHTGSVFNIFPSPDRMHMATCSFDRSVKIWDMSRTGENIDGHLARILGVHFHPSGKLIATASRDKTLKLWDVADRKEVMELVGHTSNVYSCAFSPSGERLASGSRDSHVKLWDVRTGAEVSSFAATDETVNSLWNSTTGVEVAKLQHKQAVNKVAFSPDGELVCSACADKTARVWSVATHEAVQELDHDAPVLAASFSPDGTLLATASAGKVLVWRVADWSQTSSIVAHAKQVNSIKWSADGRLLLTASEDRTVCVSRLKDQSRVSLMSDAFDGVCDAEFTSDGERILTVGHDNVVRVYSFDVSSTSYRSSAQLMCCLTGHTGSVFNIFPSPDRMHMATCSFDRSIWDMSRTGENIDGHLARILGVHFHPSGKLIATASRDKTLKLWDVADRKEVMELVGHTSNVYSCAFSPSGERLASGSRDSHVKLWDVRTGAEVSSFAATDETVNSVCWSPDGSQLLTGCTDKLVKMWDPRAPNSPSCTLYGHREAVTSVAWAPNSRKVATGSEDCTCKLWDARSHRKLATYSGHQKGVQTVAFSVESTRIYTGADDNVVREWDAVRGKLTHQWRNNTSSITSLCCTVDGKKLVVGSTDSSFVVYDTIKLDPIASFTLLSLATA